MNFSGLRVSSNFCITRFRRLLICHHFQLDLLLSFLDALIREEDLVVQSCLELIVLDGLAILGTCQNIIDELVVALTFDEL